MGFPHGGGFLVYIGTMHTIDRRVFLSSLTGAVISASAQQSPAPSKASDLCWLDVAAPFVVVDPTQELNTELLLTATCFPGIDGFRNARYATEYQVLLYDNQGKEIPLDNNGRLEIGSLRPTLLDLRQWAKRDAFFGGARVRVAPSKDQMPHAGDLFSAGFVRWNLPHNFDNIHAQPAPPQQLVGHFNYSMPFPPLSEYHCALAVFNLADDESWGLVRVVDRLGRDVAQRNYRLRPHQTTLYSMSDLKPVETPGEAMAVVPSNQPKLDAGGVVVVRNESDKAAFAYTIVKGRTGASFTVEHPLHFAVGAPMKPARKTPYGDNRSFPAEGMVFTPMLFRGAVVAGVTLESRFYLSASRWIEEALWMMPFVTTDAGQIAWASNHDQDLATRISPPLVDQGVVRLSEFQSCAIDTRALPIPQGFAGGFGAATIPRTSHSLNKVEVRAVNWGRVAMTHFRPGGTVANGIRNVQDRGGLASDYVVTDVHVIGTAANRKRDSLLAFMNIEFDGRQPGVPLVQLFGPGGLVAERQLGEYPPLACRHFLASDLFPNVQSDPAHPFTVRMQVPGAMMIVSALHFDYERRDLALEHGSDRHSTFQDYKC
jgi:hypothetical protein